jgi:aerobic C4-dicarboxylate transport protein
MAAGTKQAWHGHLYVQTLIGVGLGIVVGAGFPQFGTQLKPFGEAFVNLIKMMIGPIIFCTIVHGIASVGDLRKVGRLGIKVLVYFEVVSTLALLIGLLVVNVSQPGFGFTPAGTKFEAPDIPEKYADAPEKAKSLNAVDFAMHLIPKTLFSPFAEGDLLQILVVSLLASVAIIGLGDSRIRVLETIESFSHILFGMLKLLVKLAPLGAFGAMAFTVAEFRGEGLLRLFRFMLLFYLTAFIFIGGVLNLVAWLGGFSLWRFLVYIKEELLLVLGTSSSETALPGLMQKLVRAGCSRSTVGLVVPTGYSFNLDGTNIYMSMAAVFVCQATNTPMSWNNQLLLLAVAMLTSKGASGVTGAGLITLIATLQIFPEIPSKAAFLLIGIDRFMSECRAITNFIGNGVACLVVSRWEGELPEGPQLASPSEVEL